uniref:Regulator of G protein signaling 2 n=1 Tax=Anas platyrhynchos TaxID=8839 RepID=A0A8B9TIE4_ANAPL
MQSAMLLALRPGGRHSERGGRRRGELEEAEKGRMKRTIIKDWKKRLSYFLQNSSASSNVKASKGGKHHAYYRPSPEEARLWAEAFDELLANKYGLAAFRAFLKSEFCEENIEFWLACEDFKKTKSPQKLTSKAKKIYNDFIEKEAPKEINIDFQTKNTIAQNIQEATHTCFSCSAEEGLQLNGEQLSTPAFWNPSSTRNCARRHLSPELPKGHELWSYELALCKEKPFRSLRKQATADLKD